MSLKTKSILVVVLMAVIAVGLYMFRPNKGGVSVSTPPAIPAVKPPAQADIPEIEEKAAPQIDPSLRTPPPITPIAGNLSDSVGIVIAGGSNVSYMARMQALQSLGQSLSVADVKALLWLLDRKAQEETLRPAELNSLKDAVASLLCRQTTPPPALAGHLVRMHRDKTHDMVWRDYCLQHMGHWFKHAADDERPTVLEVLWDATTETHSSLAGTALIALAANVDMPEVDRTALGTRAAALAGDKSATDPARVTALQIAAQLGCRDILPLARSLATSRAAVPLRMSAIGAVGLLGGSEDRAMLESLAGSTDSRIRKPAEAALERIRQRDPGR